MTTTLRWLVSGAVLSLGLLSCAPRQIGNGAKPYRLVHCDPDSLQAVTFQFDPARDTVLKLPDPEGPQLGLYHLKIPGGTIGVSGQVTLRMEPLGGNVRGVRLTALDRSGAPIPRAAYAKTMKLKMSRKGCKGSHFSTRIALLREDTNEWYPVESAFDGSLSTVSGKLKHLSAYGLAVP